MSPEKDKYLVEKYPKIFRDRNADIKVTAMTFGIECEDGWFWLIDQLCDSIQSYIDNNDHLNIPQVIATQVKEKYGALCFYYNGGNDKIDGMVWLAGDMSYDICEFCGSTKDVGHTKGWCYTICKECYNNSTEYRIKMHEWNINE